MSILKINISDEEISKLFLENEADIHLKDENDCSAIHIAIENSDEKMVKLLLEKGANFNFQDDETIIELFNFFYPFHHLLLNFKKMPRVLFLKKRNKTIKRA